jgi:hypothetical protein
MKNKVLSILVILMLAAVLALPGTRTATAATANMTVVSDTTVQVTKVNGAVVSKSAVAAWEPRNGEVDPTPSYWDSQLVGHIFTGGADWIWETYRTVHPITGDIVYFEKTFSVPGVPTGGTLYITCDNGYEVSLNGSPVGSAQLYLDWENSNLYQENVDYNGWQSVETWGVSSLLVSGNNVLTIKAANEYMCLSLDGGDGTIETNPAGLIFQLDVTYEAGLGCVCSWGYWKTHSSYGPAPYDDTWEQIGEDVIFFKSGMSYYEVLQTNVSGGNAYYQLAHQYIAAKLNKLRGAWMPGDVQAAYDQAFHLFEVYTPIVVAMYKKGIPSQRAIVNQFSQLASILDAYNNGLMVTPHCS